MNHVLAGIVASEVGFLIYEYNEYLKTEILHAQNMANLNSFIRSAYGTLVLHRINNPVRAIAAVTNNGEVKLSPAHIQIVREIFNSIILFEYVPDADEVAHLLIDETNQQLQAIQYKTLLGAIAIPDLGYAVDYVQKLKSLNDRQYAAFIAGATLKEALVYPNCYQLAILYTGAAPVVTLCFSDHDQIMGLKLCTSEERKKYSYLLDDDVLPNITNTEALAYIEQKYREEFDRVSKESMSNAALEEPVLTGSNNFTEHEELLS